MQEISRLLNWHWFWEGEASWKPYTPGRVIKASIVESPNEVAVFLAEIGVAVHFRLKGDKIVQESFQGIGDASNLSAVNRYISNYRVDPGFRLRPGTTSAFPEDPFQRPGLTDEQKRQFFKQRSVSLMLPRLSPPDYISSRRSPLDLARLESTVRSSLETYYSADCGKGQALIPYFSPADPFVYVYADLGTCGKGIIPFSTDESGQWMHGQLSLDRAPNDWRTTIQRIRENTAATIPLRAE